MVKVFAISYDISDSKEDHTQFVEAIKALGEWQRFLNSIWLVEPSSESTAKDIVDVLIPLMDSVEDYLLVLEITPENNGLLPEDAWEWLSERGL